MTDANKLTAAEAAALIAAVLGENDQPAFGHKPPTSGDIALVLKAGGGCEIVTFLKPDATDDAGRPLDMTQLSMRGMVAVTLFKLAHHQALMADLIAEVSGELNMGKTPKGVLDS